MVFTPYLISAFLLLVAACVIFRILVRRDYQRVGRLRPLTAVLEFLIWGAFVCFPCIYNASDWWLVWLAEMSVGPLLRIMGWGLIVIGMGVVIIAMGRLGARRTIGQTGEALERRWPYQASRNPQIVGFGLAVVGIALLWPSWYALGWVVLYGVIAHMMVLTEEEHLRNQYGEGFARYGERVPRYLGLPRSESAQMLDVDAGADTLSGLIVVLGSPNTDQGELYSIAKERCVLALTEFARHPGYKILLTGGYGAHFNTTNQPHAAYLKRYLTSRGIPEDCFVEHAESSNTLEDASLSKPIALKYGARQLLVITSDYHLDRARYVFEKEFADTRIAITFSTSRTDEAACQLDLEDLKRHEGEALARLKRLNET
jgi:uncharacterized SAM-binding protein YcdF (DUF218 family)